jgi:hypothetical protein
MARQYCETHPGIVVVMLDAGASRPTVIGDHPQCEVAIVNK